MKKSVVESFLGEKVKVKCYDNDEYIGILEKGTSFEEGYYHCKQEINGHDNHWFRSSHIKSILLGGI
ncbi:MAG: hypothetical protein KHZ82_02495 [Peptoniphilus harei]|nr:hypothetical protein [Peptoniphilus harei]